MNKMKAINKVYNKTFNNRLKRLLININQKFNN